MILIWANSETEKLTYEKKDVVKLLHQQHPKINIHVVRSIFKLIDDLLLHDANFLYLHKGIDISPENDCYKTEMTCVLTELVNLNAPDSPSPDCEGDFLKESYYDDLLRLLSGEEEEIHTFLRKHGYKKNANKWKKQATSIVELTQKLLGNKQEAFTRYVNGERPPKKIAPKVKRANGNWASFYKATELADTEKPLGSNSTGKKLRWGDGK